MKNTTNGTWLLAAMTVSLLDFVSPAALTAERDSSKPNIVVILADDLGYGDLGCYGARKIQTPHIDRIAKEGILLTDAHAPASVCTPTRYGLITGRYCWRSWLKKGVLGPTSPLLLDKGQPTVASVLKSVGYATGCVGKWHLGLGSAHTTDFNGDIKPGPLEVGFTYFFGEPCNRILPINIEDHRVQGLREPERIVVVQTKDKTGKSGTRIDVPPSARCDGSKRPKMFVEKAVAFIEKSAAGPFFLYLAPNHIHAPMTPDVRFVGTSQCGRYGDFIHELDWMVGEVLASLDRLKLADNTLVIFTSDNGGAYYMHRGKDGTPNPAGGEAYQMGHRINGDLVGQKWDVWEGGHRVPFVARWPGTIKAGSRSREIVCLTDILATCAAITGQTLPENAGPDSFNLLPALLQNNTKPIRDYMVLHSGTGMFGIRQGDWMFIDGQGSGGNTMQGEPALRYADLHYTNTDINDDGTIKPGSPPGQLYDLAKDPRQTTNLYTQHPEIVERLKVLLEKCKADGHSRP
jgi:arylsulfatase A-like enzyme